MLVELGYFACSLISGLNDGVANLILGEGGSNVRAMVSKLEVNFKFRNYESFTRTLNFKLT